MQHPTPQTLNYAIPGVIIAIVFALRFRSLNRDRHLKLEFMWIPPALMLLGVVAMFSQLPPHGTDWLWLALIFAIGGAIGWLRGRMIPISIDPETHLLNTRMSPAELMFLLGLFAVRFALKALFQAEAETWHINTVLLTDDFVVFGVGLLGGSRIEMALRAWGLLRQARAARAVA